MHIQLFDGELSNVSVGNIWYSLYLHIKKVMKNAYGKYPLVDTHSSVLVETVKGREKKKSVNSL